MALNEKQFEQLLRCIASTKEDEIDCDECLALMAEYVESKLKKASIPDSLLVVEVHLAHCPCCMEEFEVIVASLTIIG